MVLHRSPFPNACCRGLHAAAWALVFPAYWLADRLIAICVSTRKEREERAQDACYLRPLYLCVLVPVVFLAFLLSLPFALLGFLVWLPLQSARRPYAYSSFHGGKDRQAGRQQPPLTDLLRQGGRSFSFASANVCLLPDSLARFSNLSHTQRRSREMGLRIRNGVGRPPIRILVDSPTDTSESNTSLLDSEQHGGGGGGSMYGALRRTTSLQSHTSAQQGGQKRGGAQQGSREDIQYIDRETPEDDRTGGGGGEKSKDDSCSVKIEFGDGDAMTNGTEAVPLEDGRRDAQANNDRSAACANLLSERMAKASRKRASKTGEEIYSEVAPFFPADLDFLCLQEVFDKRAAAILCEQLHPCFPYILSDVGVYAFHGCQFKFFNSGLFLASRFPILDAAYHCYPNGRKEDILAAKGVLFAKVHVGSTAQDQRIVGYIASTHLQALEEDADIRCEQLDRLLEWKEQFVEATSDPARPQDLVVFDVLCGDFNFDNSSEDDRKEQQHRLFSHYTDPCRLAPGRDKPWTVGTLLHWLKLHEEKVSHPESLQKVLESEESRREYIVLLPFNSKDPPESVPANGRRIDYLLHCQEHTTPLSMLEMEEFTFITQLAGLSDHIPISMKIRISARQEP